MLRPILIAPLLAFAAGCASAPVAVKLTASTIGPMTSEEVDCLSECLDSADENCESCVAQCLKPVSEAVPPLALFK